MPEYERAKKGPKKDHLLDRMDRHALAAELMWEGLIAPSDSAWQAGATELLQAPVAAPSSQPALSKDVAAGLRGVRQLALRASKASSADEREVVYSELLSACSDCHQRLPKDEP